MVEERKVGICERCHKRKVLEYIAIYDRKVGLCQKCDNKFWKKWQRFILRKC